MRMTGFDLNKAMTDIDERFLIEAEPGNKKFRAAEEISITERSRKKVFRVALIAACLVALLAGTVAASTMLRGKRFLDLIESEGGAEILEESVIPMGIVKEGSIKVTLEDIIGDKDIMYAEFSTDIPLDRPDGFVCEDLATRLDITGGVVGDDDEESPYWMLRGTGSAAFCRDGKLWYAYYITYTSEGEEELDLGHQQIRLNVAVKNSDREVTDNFVFEWTNDYDAKTETFAVNETRGEWLVTGMDLSRVQLVIYAEAKIENPEEMKLDYIRLSDGTIWNYDQEKGFPVKHLSAFSYDGSTTRHYRIYNLLGEFSKEGSNTHSLIPFEKIVGVSINGTEIRIR